MDLQEAKWTDRLWSKLDDLLFFLLALTLSFDTFLTFEFLNFTIRISHFLALFLTGIIFLKRAQRRRLDDFIKTPLTIPTGIFLIIALFSIFQSHYLQKSIGYLLWAAFDFGIIYLGVVNYCIEDKGKLAFALKCHLVSYTFCAVFGLLQMYGYLLGFPPFLIAQWLTNDFPRINGFNYEPSYFAFFITQGFAIAVVMWIYGEKIYGGWSYLFRVAILATSLYISTSRSGWIAMGAVFLAGALLSLKKKMLARYLRGLLLIVVLVGMNIAAIDLLSDSDESYLWTSITMAGKVFDLYEESSSRPRLISMYEGLKIFWTNPIVGVGIGGYGGYFLNHPEIHVMPLRKNAHPYEIVTPNLWIEVLAELGIFGFGALIAILVCYCSSLMRAIKTVQEGPYKVALVGYLFAALILFLIAYQFNPTLYRVDVWFLLGMGIGLVKSANLARKTS